MHRTAIAFFTLLLLVSMTYAQPEYDIEKVEITFDISPDNSVRQTTKFYFDRLPAGSLNYTLSDIVRNVDISDASGQLEHAIVSAGDGYNMQIFLRNPTGVLAISYTSDSTVFVSNSVKHLFTEISLGKPVANMSVDVKLPIGYGVYQNSYIPDFSTVSDGERIILRWQGPATAPVLISVKFVQLQQNTMLLVVIFLVFFMAFLYIYLRKKAGEEFIRGFMEDEKTTIHFLSEKKVALQKDLQTQFKFSRAKATRIVSKLEKKGLLRKQKYGRTNKLYWLKK